MRLKAITTACVAVAFFVVTAIVFGYVTARAQEDSGGMGMGPSGGMEGGTNSDTPASNESMPPPMEKMRIREQVTGSMLAAPPYGIAPMRVGFFVLADDPEGIGFLTYSWNFGDGTVSALPPELYIFHTYNNPGTYVCTLTIKTVDGRGQTFRQGVVVKAPAS
jgi:PKD domain